MSYDPPPDPGQQLAEKMAAITRRCGAARLYKTGSTDDVVLICDRRPGHKGAHRGRAKFEELTETIRWRQR